MKRFHGFCLLVALWLLLGGSAMAHKVNLFAYVESGTVYTESYFADGHKVAEGKVAVHDSADRLLLEGKTDKEGLFSFPVPKVDDLTIVLDAGMGHKASFKLKKDEVEAGK
jgi:nickel transport protein